MKTSAEKSSRTTSKTATPAAQPFFAKAGGGNFFAPAIQMKMAVNKPGDKFEQEADSMAYKIMRMPTPTAGKEEKIQRKPEEKLQKKAEDKIQKAAMPEEKIQKKEEEKIQKAPANEEKLQRDGTGVPAVSGNVQSAIQNKTSGGQPLSNEVRNYMEPRFNADFSKVRIHTDAESAGLNNQLSARAFTYQNHIFFSKGQYQSNSSEGKQLLAHELTHTIQQGHAVQRSPQISTTSPPPTIQRLGIRDALDYFANRANIIPGFRIFTIVLGTNPLNMQAVDRSATNILRALIEIIPGGALITQALDNHGVFNRVGDWVEQQFRTLSMSASIVRNAINRFLDSLSWTDIFNLSGLWDRARNIISEPIDRLLAFGRSLVNGIIQFIKDAILRPLAQLASQTRGWDLLCAVLGRNPITGEAVPRTADNLIGGFMKLIGQDEVWENIKRANAIARAWAWFQGALSGVLGFVQEIPALFLAALRSLEIIDIILVPRALARVAGVFASFVGRFLSWAGEQVMSLLQIIFEVVAPAAVPYIRRAAGAFRTIIQNPVGFVGNLVRAGIQGFRQFAGNFLTHLRTSLVGWLTGAMSGANIYIPQAFTLQEILKFVLSVLGLTWQNIRVKLVRAIGETAVGALETGFDLVVTLVREGPAAAWQKILESINNLREMVIQQVMNFVQTNIVQAAITRLLTSLNPVGAFIQAIIATYNTIMFFVERLQQIGRVAMAFIDSIAAIASGNISAAANRVEQTMAGMLTLVISFLARIVGLGNVAQAVTNIIDRVRLPIDRALDRVVDWIVAGARRLGNFFRGRDARSPEEKQRDLQSAAVQIRPQLDSLLLTNPSTRCLNRQLARWRSQYRLTTLALEGNQIIARINPELRMTDSEHRRVGLALEPVLRRVEETYLRLLTGPEQEEEPDTSHGFSEQAMWSAFASASRPIPNRTARDIMRIRQIRQNPERAPNIERTETGGTIEYYRNPENSAQYFVRPERVGEAAYENMQIPNVPLQSLPADQRTILMLEQARSRGNVATAQVAHALSEQGDTSLANTEDIVRGPLNALAYRGSGRQADRQSWRGQRVSRSNRRHAGIGRIFDALRAVLSRQDEVISKPGGATLLELAQAFETWLQANILRLPNLRSQDEINRATARLEGTLLRFLHERLHD